MFFVRMQLMAVPPFPKLLFVLIVSSSLHNIPNWNIFSSFFLFSAACIFSKPIFYVDFPIPFTRHNISRQSTSLSYISFNTYPQSHLATEVKVINFLVTHNLLPTIQTVKVQTERFHKITITDTAPTSVATRNATSTSPASVLLWLATLSRAIIDLCDLLAPWTCLDVNSTVIIKWEIQLSTSIEPRFLCTELLKVVIIYSQHTLQLFKVLLCYTKTSTNS